MNQAVACHQPQTHNSLPPILQAAPPVLRDEAMAWTMPDVPPGTPPIELRYRLHGNANGPVIVALGGISANRQVQCWWRSLYGQGHCLDPKQIRVLGIDWLDHAGAPESVISTSGQAHALAAVLDHLGIERIRALIGASYGAMVGLAFAERHGHRLDHLVAISGADRARPAIMAIRHLQREILRLGDDTGQIKRAVALARALAMTTYRPAALFDRRFEDAQPDEALSGVSAYLDHVGRCFSDNFDAGRYQRLSESLDRHQVDPSRIHCPVDLVSVDSDHLVTAEEMARLAGELGPDCRLHPLSSPYGHDAFLKEPQAFNALLSELIAGEVQS